MKKKRIIFIIAISAISLVGLVILQINWIRHAASLRESQLKHRVTLASYRLRYQLSHDKVTTKALTESLRTNNAENLVLNIHHTEQARIDSLLKAEFRYHHINLKYRFEIVDKAHKDYYTTCESNTASHSLCLEGLVQEKRAELRIIFLNKNQYIFAQMGWMLIASFILIALVAACFVLTIKTIWRQKKVSEMTGDFISNMTHELKTPISTVSLASNMLRKEKILANKDKIVHYSGVIHEENKKLQAQVEQVLRIAKLERGEFKLEKTKIKIHDIIQDAIGSIDLQVTSKDGQIRCYLNAFKDEVIADVTHLTNVVSNLLDNANKYSPKNPEITITTHNKEDGVVISVEDKGIGMSKDKQKYIFNKFYRVPTGNIHNVKGFGLGLAYVKMMVDAHKGQIFLNSEPGKGSKFDIFLPFG